MLVGMAVFRALLLAPIRAWHLNQAVLALENLVTNLDESLCGHRLQAVGNPHLLADHDLATGSLLGGHSCSC